MAAPRRPTAPPTEDRSEAFPVTIEHTYGETTIEAPPERIVTVGLTEQDALLALGIVPVGTTEWFGEHPGAVWPWATDELDALDAETPVVVGDGTAVNYEMVAAQRPDLILAVYAGLTPDDYDKLAAIAPTVAQPEAYVEYGVPWEELTRTVGAAVGLPDEADALVAEVEAEFAAVVADHPEFDGASSVMATPYEGTFVYGPEDARGRFLTALGFELPPDLVEVTGEEYGGNVSAERADLLDVDAIVWLDAGGRRRTPGRTALRDVRGAPGGARGVPRQLRRPARRRDLVRERPEPAVPARRARPDALGGRRRRPGDRGAGQRQLVGACLRRRARSAGRARARPRRHRG